MKTNFSWANFNWGLVGVIAFGLLCIALGAMICMVMTGCGVHAELEKPDGTRIYYNRGWLSPENVTVEGEGISITIGEQASQKAMIEGVLKLGIAVGSGGVVPE
jgi:hypothetical protein